MQVNYQTVVRFLLLGSSAAEHRCHGLSLQRIDIAITSVTPLLANRSVQSETERGRDQCQSVAMTRPVNLRYSFLYRVARHLTVGIVVSAIAVFRLVDHLIPSRLQIVYWHFILNSNRLQNQTVTPDSIEWASVWIMLQNFLASFVLSTLTQLTRLCKWCTHPQLFYYPPHFQSAPFCDMKGINLHYTIVDACNLFCF